MAKRIKVGLDQWVVAGKDQAELLTDGLSGCVAVMLWSGEQGCLAHVYSGCDSECVSSYRHELDLPFVVMKRRSDSFEGGAIAYSDESETWLAKQMKLWLSQRLEPYKAKVETYSPVSGVRLAYDDLYGWEVFDKENDDTKLYRTGYDNTTTGVGSMSNWGRLSKMALAVEL